MTLTFKSAQQQVDERVNQHPEGYRPDDKIFRKMEEEKREIENALQEYQKSPTEENMKAFKTEIGDELFAIICLANSKGISLDECINLMMEKNRNRAKNKYQK